jgi:hypothetical protein
MKEPDVRNPYEHMQAARRAEDEGNMRRAEAQWKAAVVAADSLPLVEYKRNFKEELVRYAFDPAYEARPGVSEQKLRDAYCDLLAQPFTTRMYLATFYARYGAYPEAKEACDQAFAYGMDALAKEHCAMGDFFKRAEIVRQNLHEHVGPEDLPLLLSEAFDEIDKDGDGFLSDAELEQAQFDLSLPADIHRAVKYLLENYHDVEAAHRDEWMNMADIRGISRRDLRAHEQKKNSTWKRMPKR